MHSISSVLANSAENHFLKVFSASSSYSSNKGAQTIVTLKFSSGFAAWQWTLL
jgi:hypothetical protein